MKNEEEISLMIYDYYQNILFLAKVFTLFFYKNASNTQWKKFRPQLSYQPKQAPRRKTSFAAEEHARERAAARSVRIGRCGAGRARLDCQR